jgi:ABC-type branched-subunit amino acid transport system ATPase component
MAQQAQAERKVQDANTLLKVTNLGIVFGGLHAVDQFNLTIQKGQLYGLIGPNGV